MAGPKEGERGQGKEAPEMAVSTGQRPGGEETPGEERHTEDTGSTDVEEYLEVIEGLVKKLQKREELCSYLQPVMNNACRTMFKSMPQDKRADYEELKKVLLATCSIWSWKPAHRGSKDD